FHDRMLAGSTLTRLVHEGGHCSRRIPSLTLPVGVADSRAWHVSHSLILWQGCWRGHTSATKRYRISAAFSTCSRTIHSSDVWAWAMSPGPKTIVGMPAAAIVEASVLKATPLTLMPPETAVMIGRSCSTKASD